MSYSPSPSLTDAREAPSAYSPSPTARPVYELSLRTGSSPDWLRDLSGAHRLVQTLLQGRLMGHYELLDFLIWPDGLFLRIALTGARSLSEFLVFLKEKSVPAGQRPSLFWDDELQWIKLVPAEKVPQSTAAFLETVEGVRRRLHLSRDSAPPLFFLYRDSRLSR